MVNTRPNARETVRLESETGQALLERPVSKPFMGILEALFRPTPLVDNIQEKEKYGNSGDKFIGIGRALVNSFEGFSNFLNAVVDVSVPCFVFLCFELACNRNYFSSYERS